MEILKNIQNSMLRMGDSMELRPLDGRRGRRRINRTQVTFEVLKGATEQIRPCHIRLRASKVAGKFELRNRESGVMEFRSLSDTPFIHNGNLSFSSLLKRGDILDLDYNRLTFLSGDLSKESQELPFLRWPSDIPLCLEGETGTGKSTLAKKIHDKFIGSHLPFIQINLSSFSEGLIESELFGHEKGAFTGALREKRGAIELANKGTLFIDEVDSLPLHIQVKLLTFLDDFTFRRVGGEVNKKSTCRIIFASGRSLKQLVAKGQFRSDLYFRISAGLNHCLPPLRENPLVIKTFIEDFATRNGVCFTNELVEYYMKQYWPGNIRQLMSHLTRKVLGQQREEKIIRIDSNDSEISLFQPQKTNEEIVPLEEFKREYCKSIFLHCNGSYENASKKLGIAKSTLRRVIAA
ncbi:MAG: sigma 54-interacting transcriptional regulator [Bacteriovoracaceae bacterium]|nr:sigma 54-interacting transcriptional regulator [Bacteriovoracaceae bacterium]